MNLLNEIINEKTFINDKLYLLNKPTNDFGFFYQNGVIYFAKKSSGSTSGHSVDTSYLDMHLCVPIISDSENGSFESGNYDMLAFKGDLNSVYFDVYYNVCVSYANDSSELEFSDFFNSIVEIFKTSKDGSNRNLIGLMGELYLIKSVFEDYGINIADNWHLAGSNGKFDFNFDNFNIEVKTTTGNEMKFLLKHEQIFNNQNNYICVISLIETGMGESLESFSYFFTNNYPFKNNVKFQIAIQSELLRITELKDKQRSFALDSIDVFECKTMKTIENIPACLTKIQYEYNFSDIESTDLSKLFE